MLELEKSYIDIVHWLQRFDDELKGYKLVAGRLESQVARLSIPHETPGTKIAHRIILVDIRSPFNEWLPGKWVYSHSIAYRPELNRRRVSPTTGCEVE